MSIKILITLSIFFVYNSSQAQYTLKVKKEDNRFLFFQVGTKNDTIIKNKSDLFFIKFPDSLKQNIQIFLKNGQFTKTDNDSIYRLVSIIGMKYSHSKPDSVFNTLLEGICTPSKTISIQIINTLNKQLILQNNFIVH
jgi:hypothetical protein